MSLLPIAAGSITIALCIYTYGVFSERKHGILQKKHVIAFWCGLAFDTCGTLLMKQIAQAGAASTTTMLHGITGALAILLMLFHASWATFCYIKKKQTWLEQFHKFSFTVWCIWLIPFILGMMLGMMR